MHKTILAFTMAAALAAELPKTEKRPVTEVYHGIKVTDEYRWLEDASSPQVTDWIKAENEHTRSYMDKLAWRPILEKRIEELMGGDTVVSYSAAAWANGKFFGMRSDPKLEQPQLIVFTDPRRPEDGRAIVDPNALEAKGVRTIDWFQPSPDARYVGVSMSDRGSEIGDLHLFETETGKPVDVVIARVQVPTAGGNIAWAPDSKGLYYTRYPRAGERSKEDSNFYQQLWFHKLGSDPKTDTYEIGRDFPRIAEIKVATHVSGAVLASVQNGDGGEFFHYVKPAGSREWRRITQYSDRVVQMDFAGNGDLIAISRSGAPRGKLLLVSRPDYLLKKARVMVPQGADNIVNDHYGTTTVVGGANRVYVTVQTGGPSEIRVFGYDGKAMPAPVQAPVSAVGTMVPVGGDDLLFFTASYFTPSKGKIYRAETGKTEETGLGSRVPVDYSQFEAVREFATSKDGTRVPVSILRRKGLKLDGSHPVVATGYGGFGLSIQPFHRSSLKALLEAGVVFATANLRGGGEFGEGWHDDGRLTRKQNVFDDFEAVLRHMVQSGYSTPQRMGIVGGSNGGLLVGALITQHPELVRAAVIDVGLLDMLRSELSANGAFNVVEYGTVKEKQHFDALYAYSPYHRVRDGAKYPATLLATGLNDGRVEPMHSFKMTARLQAATGSGYPVLLTVDADAGHGFGMRRKSMIARLSEQYAFLLNELGVAVPDPK
jgi:prolyl oligopeptidase